MRLTVFWNKAIEYYCTLDRTVTKEGFDTIFIAVSEEVLERIKEKYTNSQELSEKEVELVNNNIESVGGTINSYYSSVKEVHNDLNRPEQYSFLRFSILVVGAFKQDDSPLRNYWKDFDPFLLKKGITIIKNRTKYLNRLILNLSKWCYLKHEKTFFQLNVFGEHSTIVNVGRIKSHSVFQGKTLKRIKKSIYSLGYSDSHSIEDLSIDEVEEIIIESGLTRILNLFKREDAKEIVYVCLKIWLKKWEPSQVEKAHLLKGNASSKKAGLSIFRIWTINRNKINPEVEIKYGFVYKTAIGENSIYYLNQDENIYIDTSWPIKLSDNRVLYVIENYNSIINLNQNDLGLKFKPRHQRLNENAYILEKIPNLDYFLEHLNKRVLIKDNPIIIASNFEINNVSVKYFSDFPIKNQNDKIYKLYRVTDSVEVFNLIVVKTNNLTIVPVGISDGRNGFTSFLSSFPVKLKVGDITRGKIDLIRNKIKTNSFNLENIAENFDVEIELGTLLPGNYMIKYSVENDNYLNFQSGQDSIDFEIVESGVKDARIESNYENTIFKYHEFPRLNPFNSSEDSCVIFRNNEELLKFKDNHIDFYFSKSYSGELIVKVNKDIFYLQTTFIKPIKNELNFDNWILDLVYLSTKFHQYHYKIQFCDRSESLKLPFNFNNFYHKNNLNRVTNDYIIVDCYYYKLVEMDNELKKKFPEVSVGDVLYILSNKRESHPEKLLKLVNQEFFPFKKHTDERVYK